LNHKRDSELVALLNDHTSFIRNSLRTYERDQSRQEELYQEVALALWRALPSFRGEASHRTLIARITHNIGVSHIRRMMSRPATDLLEDIHISDLASPEAEMQHQDQKRVLLTAIGKLPLGLQQSVTLHLEDFSNREIGEILGLSEGAVAVRLTRARASLSRLMEQQK
tara:strand:+ start:18271 stop:18774 length:504 start_codon:yes stop_codon:yes gene_type:complete